jgi:hypothetical protein
MTEAIRLQRHHLEIKKKTFCSGICLGAQPVRQLYERLQGDPAWMTHTIESGDDAMLDKPEELASLLRHSIAPQSPM